MSKTPSERVVLIKKVLLSKKATELVNLFFKEDTHFVDKARYLVEIKKESGLSERELSSVLKCSKSEIHRYIDLDRSLSINAKLADAARKYGTDKYVFLMLRTVESGALMNALCQKILNGKLVRYGAAKDYISSSIN